MPWVTRNERTFIKCLWIVCKTSGSRYRVYSDCEGLTDAVSAPTVKGKVNASQSIYEANAGAGAESCGTWDPEINGLRSAHTVRGSVWSLYPSLVKIISTHKVLQICTNWQGWKDVVSVFYQSSEGSEKYKWGKDAKSETSCSWYAENPRRNLALHKPVLTSWNTQFSSLPSAFILVFFSFILVCEWEVKYNYRNESREFREYGRPCMYYAVGLNFGSDPRTFFDWK